MTGRVRPIKTLMCWTVEVWRSLRATARGVPIEFAATTLAIARDPSVAHLLGTRPFFASRLIPVTARHVVGWGRRPSGLRAARLGTATRTASFIEDGFLRSVGRHDRPVSLILDDGGIYYDAASDSRLFRQIKRPLSPDETARAQAICQTWRQLELSKYNPPGLPRLAHDQPYVLVADQSAGDRSIAYGQANEARFVEMLDAALAGHPTHRVLVKLHPDTLNGPGRAGHFDPAILGQNPRITVLDRPVQVGPLIAGADAVYTVTSQIGFEALMHGKPVHVFGMPFYAGWGLTQDARPRPDTRSDASLAQLVHAALVDYPHYLNPTTGKAMTPEAAMARVGELRSIAPVLSRGANALGFSRWKWRFMRAALGGTKLRFGAVAGAGAPSDDLLIWGNKDAGCAGQSQRIIRVEDGFLRSVGLGAALTPPQSLVFDDLGIYFDATRQSRLETLLETCAYSAPQLSRAAALRAALIAHGIGKYNLGGAQWVRPQDQRPMHLVVGQVESDASIRFGLATVAGNLALLTKVRQAQPNAHILYAPHPDVQAGLRSGGDDPAIRAGHADEVLYGHDMLDLVGKVDRVHTITSLLGFEALLRGVAVTCYGLPFYAGWGLTDDRVACARRTRRIDLDTLTYAALIDYPRYFARDSFEPVLAEDALADLIAIKARGPARDGLRVKLRGRVLAALARRRP